MDKNQVMVEGYSYMGEHLHASKKVALERMEYAKNNPGTIGDYTIEGFDYLMALAEKLDDTSAYYIYVEIGLHFALLERYRDEKKEHNCNCSCSKK